jgi:hypothetical protein
MCANNTSKIFKVKIQADTIGNKLQEVQQKSQDLKTFGTLNDTTVLEWDMAS